MHTYIHTHIRTYIHTYLLTLKNTIDMFIPTVYANPIMLFSLVLNTFFFHDINELRVMFRLFSDSDILALSARDKAIMNGSGNIN